ncbi:MAG: PQQ-like beta-propeller repeat protein [Gemmataceae bacterium]|nr:PQQ-like beta-propeller repeat protein [Gemmataceae bacterium]
MNKFIPIGLLLLSPCLASAADWTQFRGANGTGISDEQTVPTKWSKTEGIRWKVELPGRGLSSPVIADGRVYVTACTGYQQTRLHVLCFDAASGKKLWERQFWATGGTGCHPNTSMAAPTPATDGQRVYALFATCDLVCLDRDGNLVWLRALTKDYPTVTNQVGMAASPILYKDVLVVQMENAGESFVAGIDKLTGKNKWKHDRERQINWVTPLVANFAGREVLLVQSPAELSAFNPLTGEKVWKYQTKGIATIPSAVAGKDMIFLPGGDLEGLRPDAKGSPELAWTGTKLKPATASPLYYKDHVYTLSGAGILNCAEAATGKVVHQERLKGPFSASPIAANGNVYCTNEEGTTFVVQVGENVSIVATNSLGDTILGSPAISGGAIYLRSDQYLYCIGEKK